MADAGDEVTGRARGGVARAAALSVEERSHIARRAAAARWSKNMPYATHEGVIAIGTIELPCAVLNTGQRVLTQSGFMRALGRARQAKGRQHYRGDINLPAFLTAQNLKPFISDVLEITSSQIEFVPKNGHNLHAFQKPMQGDHRRGIVVEQMRRFARHRFASQQSAGQLRQRGFRPAVVRIARINRRHERAGINQYDAL